MEKRGSFSSRFGAIAAVGGSAVGIGSIWRFPHVAGENGGAAFIILYIVMSLLISIPLMMTEFSLGRASQANSKRAFQVLSPGSKWGYVGYIGILCAFVILSFYCVISGWALEYLRLSLFNEFAQQSPADVKAGLNAFVASGWKPILWMGVFMVATAGIVLAGIEKGIERYSKVLMPLFAVMLTALAVRSLFLEGASEGISFLLSPDWSKVNGKVVLEALGQSFFSMSLGMGCMITYGSYIKSHENMFQVSGAVTIAGVVIAILAGLAIFPAVFTFGISPTSGPDLVFLTLPNIFAQMTGGYFVGIIFFFLLFVAAITSSISLFEVIIAYLSEEMKLSRTKATCITLFVLLILGSLCALSQMPNSPLTIGGNNLFDSADSLALDILMPLGGLLIVIFAGWFLKPSLLRNQITNEGKIGTRIFPTIYFLIKYIIPLVILYLFLNALGIL